jgi:hypothetical protein
MQFDLHVNVNRAAVKAAALEKLWNNCYNDHPAEAANRLGIVIAGFHGRFPQLSREEFDREFGEAIDQSFENVERTLPERHQEIRQFMAGTKILCLSEVDDNILMWSHYSEQHQGLVLRFRCVPELDSAWGAAEPVQYVNQMPRLLDEELLSNLLSGSVSINHRDLVHKLIYTKASCWSYEKEWRICIGSGRTQTAHEDLRFNPRELNGVIFGCKMSSQDRKELTDLIRLRYPHATIYEAKRAEQDFSLTITPV